MSWAIALPGIIGAVPPLIDSIKGLFGGAENEDAPLTSEQVQAAKAAQEALQKATAPSEAYDADQAAFIGNILFPGFKSVIDLALGGATRNVVTGGLFPIFSATQEWASAHNFQVDSSAKVPSPEQAKGPTDTALAEAYRFAQVLVA